MQQVDDVGQMSHLLDDAEGSTLSRSFFSRFFKARIFSSFSKNCHACRGSHQQRVCKERGSADKPNLWERKSARLEPQHTEIDCATNKVEAGGRLCVYGHKIPVVSSTVS